MPDVFIGCSGFSYQHWKNIFYPPGLPTREWLPFYSRVFHTVELNVTFYRLPRASSFEAWRDETPGDFAFSVKGSRYITHIKRLLEPEKPLELFFERAALLGKKLRVVLWQFAPNFPLQYDRLAAFLKLLSPYPCHHTFEFRHPSWITPEVVGLCREFRASLCMADRPAHLTNLPLTADAVYVRRHGKTDGSRYSITELKGDAALIKRCAGEGRDVFLFFNNDAGGHAVEDARKVAGLLEKEAGLHS